jgi:ribokinase
VGAVGADELGAEAVAQLEREGVDCSGVARLQDPPTGVALIVVDDAGENQIAVASGANARLARPAVPRGARIVLLGLEVPDEAVLAAARAAGDARIVLNPAPARPIPDELLDLGPILTPNEGEARTLTGEPDAQAAARALEHRTGAPVVVTLGARGALVGGEVIAPPPVRPVDTTGAGDTFSGALAAELARGADLAAATRFATAAAALSTQGAGARGGMPGRAAVEALLS